MSSRVTHRARLSKVGERLQQARSRSESPTLADKAVFRVAGKAKV